MSKAEIRIVVEQKNEQGEWQRVDTTDVLGYCLMMITSKSGKGFSGTISLENVDTADVAMMMMDCGELRKAAMAAADVIREKRAEGANPLRVCDAETDKKNGEVARHLGERRAEHNPETIEQIMARIARENGLPGFTG